MNLVLTYTVTVFIIAAFVFLSLYFNPERKRKYKEKKAIATFHLCNMLFIFIPSFLAYMLMTIYIIEDMSKIAYQVPVLLFTALSFYTLGNIVIEHYKYMLRKYESAENGKVLILNKEYLKRK